MAVEFSQSRTKENLMKAFAGESQARNRYTIAGRGSVPERFFSRSRRSFFLRRIRRERMRPRFYELLKTEAGENIRIEGGYPVDQSESLVELLMMAAHIEQEEHQEVYPAFAKTAEEEGFPEAAYAFSQIADSGKNSRGAFCKDCRKC